MMAAGDGTYAFVRAFLDELVQGGVRHLCLCPGSRSTPLALEAARHPLLRVWVHLDERSCAFFALGMAKALRSPVALLSTSGTAAANFLPAVVEARYGYVPLVVLTADRPHELRDCGANQTIDQVHLYGRHAKWFVELPIPEATPAALRYARSVAARCVEQATAPPPGPVHVNVPLREPLVPAPAEGRGEGSPPGRARGPSTRPLPSRLLPDPDAVAEVARAVGEQERGLVVCGPLDHPRFPQAVTELACALQFPLLADSLSQVRCGEHASGLVVDTYDAFLRVEELWDALRPEVILRFGAAPTSKPLLGFLAHHAEARQIFVGLEGPLDPDRVVSDFVRADPTAFCEALRQVLPPGRRADGWLRCWQGINRLSRETLDRALGSLEEACEARVFQELAQLLPDGTLLYTGNSMPVRDLDGFFPALRRRIRFLGNRGASGIDGVLSSALGAAAVHPGPVVLVLGDLSFYHDLNGLFAAYRYGLAALVVLVHNDGGGIFSLLPHATLERSEFELLFGTPHGLDFRPVVEMYGGVYVRPDGWDSFRRAIREGLRQGGLRVVEVRTDRTRNAELHRRVWAEVRSALVPRFAQLLAT
ncbi:MAG: 2-succinyl-5-enolpyruvyl-6-hydroxy-3-cyclohexene-1-carboxylic-acid synthase [Armatimonadota bacterium]|nr:2-succinyl-5-enolpyruvyl-6-hydroxy-3-cyclohexene-1-carboxylic-acid synthase [Armatimonadota bacterium]MDR7443730.1 2-succinyl-5-enolpyruvyl-6-hydroxy-3-cyclohexene-1-carboxylic-acid synthase [Armatimonadota bacterium]MDR7569927.1 2-succinyl-5-enolpyruvyl-6-hydroxy-3-cyclohexene-1-carboxylic-acid synthase [Armatimonadota bacterium]MDR7613742.1 2-succinyl-5-enolpyruvyl-6-hydroxy-3-cyclohexene-1-carboxylic-acid synthase [Armatimonadota bacterium]